MAAQAQVDPGEQRVFNISAPPVTMREIVDAICSALGRSSPRLHLPAKFLEFAASMIRMVGDPTHLAARLQKFTRDDVYAAKLFENTFGFRPKISLTEGLLRQVHHMSLSDGQNGSYPKQRS
jgi:nucleoside-diphosphate-sugar epimerase